MHSIIVNKRMGFSLKISPRKTKIIKLSFNIVLIVAKVGTSYIVALKLAKSAEK